MPASKAQQKAVSKYMKENYDVYQIRMKKGQKDTIKAHADSQGESINAFIGRAIQETMERDAGGPQEATVPGVLSLPTEALKTAQEAAGEAIPQFVARAIESRAALDKRKKPIDKGGQ